MMNRLRMKQAENKRGATTRGFTLLEMMAVMAILVVLLAIGAVRYQQSVVRAREAALTTDLKELNYAVQEYTRDKNEAPTSLDDLVPQYLAKLPIDPMTKAADWVGENCQLLDSTDQLTTGICTVHSASNEVSPFNGKPYSSWEPD